MTFLLITTLLMLAYGSSLADFVVEVTDSYVPTAIPVREIVFTKLRKLGDGGFCEVWEVQYGINVFALKKVKASITDSDEIDKVRETLDNEWNASMQWTNNGNDFPSEIVEIHAVGNEAGTENTVLLMEVLRGQPLDVLNFEECQSTEKIISVGNELVPGLETLFFAGVTHRDLKPENVQCEKLNMRGLVMFDFGLAYIENGIIGPTRRCGTYLFMSPDIQLDLDATPNADLWSLMIMLVLPVLKEKITWSQDAKDIELLILKNSSLEKDVREIERLNKDIATKKMEFEGSFENIPEINNRPALLAVLLAIRKHINLTEKPSDYSDIKNTFSEQLKTFAKKREGFYSNQTRSLQDVDFSKLEAEPVEVR